jgi:hypothetical protein
MSKMSQTSTELHVLPHLDRRRLLGLIAGGALVANLHPSTTLAQSATPSADQLAKLESLSKTLCGGGVFAEAQVAQLANLLTTDSNLMAGVEELLRGGSATPAPGSRSPAAQAAAQEILLFWYTGEFKGEPIPNHEDIYTQLQAWQAMYTPAWTVCKVYGEWANPPTMTPQEPENA